MQNCQSKINFRVLDKIKEDPSLEFKLAPDARNVKQSPLSIFEPKTIAILGKHSLDQKFRRNLHNIQSANQQLCTYSLSRTKSFPKISRASTIHVFEANSTAKLQNIAQLIYS